LSKPQPLSWEELELDGWMDGWMDILIDRDTHLFPESFSGDLKMDKNKCPLSSSQKNFWGKICVFSMRP